MNYLYLVIFLLASHIATFFLGKHFGRVVEAALHDEKNKLIAAVKAKL